MRFIKYMKLRRQGFSIHAAAVLVQSDHNLANADDKAVGSVMVGVCIFAGVYLLASSVDSFIQLI